MTFPRVLAGATLGAAAAFLLEPGGAAAHGFAGARFFPATILNDDPFVADELSLPTATRPASDADGTQAIGLGWELTKRITPDLGLSLGQGWIHLKPPGMAAATGLDALEAGIAYQLYKNPAHEAVGLIGLNASFAHTGRVQALGAPDFTTLTPVVNFGKGFGDLPASLPWLRPFAMTGNAGIDFPTKTSSNGDPNPNLLNYGFSLEYSLEYLQHQVKDVGLPAPFDRLIPLVEVAFTTGLNRGQAGQTVGTIQPGLIWSGQYVQIGAEAIIPVNRATGRGFGGVVQLHFYLDDIFPASLGRPLFGN